MTDPMQQNKRHQNRVRPPARANHLAWSIRLRQHAHGGRHGHDRDRANARVDEEHDRPAQLHRYPRANEASIAPAQRMESGVVKGIGTFQRF